MKFQVESNQRAPRIEAFGCSDTAITENKTGGTFTDHGTGDYTITFSRPFARTPVVAGLVALHATLKLYGKVTSLSTTAMRVAFFDEGGVARDVTSFFATLVGSDAADQV